MAVSIEDIKKLRAMTGAGLGFAQEKNQNSAVQEVEEKIRQNQALLQETTAEPTTEGTTTISNEAKANTEQQVKQTPITFVGDSVLFVVVPSVVGSAVVSCKSAWF